MKHKTLNHIIMKKMKITSTHQGNSFKCTYEAGKLPVVNG